MGKGVVDMRKQFRLGQGLFPVHGVTHYYRACYGRCKHLASRLGVGFGLRVGVRVFRSGLGGGRGYDVPLAGFLAGEEKGQEEGPKGGSDAHNKRGFEKLQPAPPRRSPGWRKLITI